MNPLAEAFWAEDALAAEPAQGFPDGLIDGGFRSWPHAFTLSDAGFYYITQSQQPAWFAEIASELGELLTLSRGWDGYKAPPIKRESIESAFRVLGWIVGRETPRPSVVPTVVGSVQIEWNTLDGHLEVEVAAPSRLLVLHEDYRTGETSEIEVVSDYSKLVEWVRDL